MKIIFATKNKGKLHEIRAILAGSGINVVGLEEAGITDDIIEDGTTLEENALKKARFVFEKKHCMVAAEDTGLFIDALYGEPGLYTARWPGEHGDHVAYTLERMNNIPAGERTAHFLTVAALISPSGEEYLFEGQVKGHILEVPRGQAHPHLPYDIIFAPSEGDGRTFGEMLDGEKNALSHRARAIEKMKDFLEQR